MSGLVVPVVVEGWQYECCGVPPAVGQQVAWRLELLTESWPEASVDVPVVTEEVPTVVLNRWRGLGNPVGPAPLLARHDGLVAYVQDGRRLAGGRARGVLHEEHHTDVPDEVPATAGVVERVRLVSRAYVHRIAPGFEPVFGTEELTDVAAAPPSLPWTEPPPGALRHRFVPEVLVDLRVDPR